jgi:hypothetical protein
MDFKQADLREYCGLNRSRFYVDPEQDAQWFFGNLDVERELLQRMDSDLDVRGVPKCGVVGRFGIGKTHTLNHVKWLVGANPAQFPLNPFHLDVVWDENNKDLNTYRAIHIRILDALGEPFLRTLVRKFDALDQKRDKELAEAMQLTFRFGDENLRRSLAVILADYFKREARSTVPAWQWLKAEKAVKLDSLGVPKAISDAGDMVFVLLNIGVLSRQATGRGVLLLMDEAQSIANVGKASAEVHRAFLKLADPDNRDVGFVLAVFGGGMAQIPTVLTTPEDILSRLGVTRATLPTAFIELQRILRSEADIRSFMCEVLEHLVDPKIAESIISDNGVQNVQAPHLPFTEAGLDRIAHVLYGREDTRNPRIVIDTLARCCSVAYRKAKEDEKYHIVDPAFAEPVLKDM